LSLNDFEESGFSIESHIVYLFILAVACSFASLYVASNENEKQTSNKENKFDGFSEGKLLLYKILPPQSLYHCLMERSNGGIYSFLLFL
jgi:hypothetical protein